MEKTLLNKLSNEEYEALIAKTFEGTLVKEKTIVWDTFLTNNENSAINSAINIIGDKLDNTLDDEWSSEEEKQQHTETMKYLCRIVHRTYDQDGRYL